MIQRGEFRGKGGGVGGKKDKIFLIVECQLIHVEGIMESENSHTVSRCGKDTRLLM